MAKHKLSQKEVLAIRRKQAVLKLRRAGKRGATPVELGAAAIMGERWARHADIYARQALGDHVGIELVRSGLATISGDRYLIKQTQPARSERAYAPPPSPLSVFQEDAGTWGVRRRDGHVVATGLTNQKAWDFADMGDRLAGTMEDTRLRIGTAFAESRR